VKLGIRGVLTLIVDRTVGAAETYLR